MHDAWRGMQSPRQCLLARTCPTHAVGQERFRHRRFLTEGMSSLGFVNDDSLLMISLLLWCLSILTCALARRPSAAYPLLSHSVLGFLCDNIDATWLTLRNDPMVYVRDAVIVRRQAL